MRRHLAAGLGLAALLGVLPAPAGASAGAPKGKIVYAASRYDRSDSKELSGIHVIRANGLGHKRLTHGHNDLDPHWSPDKSRIAFVRKVPVDSDTFVGTFLYLMRPDGSHKRRLVEIYHDYYWQNYFDWSPDGK